MYGRKKYIYCLLIVLIVCGIGALFSRDVFVVWTPAMNDTVLLLYKQRIVELEAQLDHAVRQASTATPTKICWDAFKQVFDREKRFICTNIAGGLGNFMFAFASVYGMAVVANKTVVIHKDNPLRKYFQVKARVIDDLCICKNAKFVYEEKHCAFSKALLNLTGDTNYRPSHYLQSWKYFINVRDSIQRQFTFKKEISLKAVSIVKNKIRNYTNPRTQSGIRSQDNMTSQSVITVGIHVRRGDIVQNPSSVEYGYMVAGPLYFQKAITYFRQKYNTAVFLVCSNDMKWCKENIIGSDVIYMEGNSPHIDLAILSQCNHSIISVGSFGWWSAFLASGETIYYRNPARNGSRLRNQFSQDFSDYFYPDWKGME